MVRSTARGLVFGGLLAAGAALLVACRTGVRPSGGAPTAPLTGQAAQGHAQFTRSCSTCHGPNGEGRKRIAPPLTKGLHVTPHPMSKYRNTEFRTAQDVHDFISTRMPPGFIPPKPSPQGYWDVTAYLLSANGIPHPEPLGPENARSVAIEGHSGSHGH